MNRLNDDLAEHEGHPDVGVVLSEDEGDADSDTYQRNQGPYQWCQGGCLDNSKLVQQLLCKGSRLYLPRKYRQFDQKCPPDH